jgi:hypothetical protein
MIKCEKSKNRWLVLGESERFASRLRADFWGGKSYIDFPPLYLAAYSQEGRVVDRGIVPWDSENAP